MEEERAKVEEQADQEIGTPRLHVPADAAPAVVLPVPMNQPTIYHHIGDPAEIGIADIDRPDWGDPVEIRQNEIPVFWACGVTPQNVVLEAALELCITHTPGSMLITDLPSNNIRSLRD